MAGSDINASDGISYRRNGQVIHNPERQLIKNLNEVPLPAWEFFPIKDYESILQFLETDRTDEVRMFLFKTQRVDTLRQENVFEIFPELEDIR